MYTSVGFVPCNGQHSTSHHPPEYRVISEVHEDIDYIQRMERKELTLSFHNLIKRGSVKIMVLNLIVLLCDQSVFKTIQIMCPAYNKNVQWHNSYIIMVYKY